MISAVLSHAGGQFGLLVWCQCRKAIPPGLLNFCRTARIVFTGFDPIGFQLFGIRFASLPLPLVLGGSSFGVILEG
jgi:hypothetical protein